ncbi:MAG: polysulfide reductase NrfD, partial [Acetobacteraceae bacterium]|nr:polysulfide reductase NrfD [Acetobacteraceae bacterium]
MQKPALPPGVQREWKGETYHGRPVTKASSFDWKVSFYIVTLGIAGAAQVIAALARARPGGAGVARRARFLALGGSLVGPLVLIQHLKTPRRWYNMLRILRPTSPMSLGSWLLAGFGALSGLTALGEMLGRRLPFARRVADAAQAPAAIAGAGMSIYTAGLLASTSTPLWAAAPGPLATQFGAASMAGAASALA